MIRIGRVQKLLVLRHSPEGLILGDDDDLEVLLPNSEAPKEAILEGTVEVFVHHDDKGGLIATTKAPRAQVGEFALLQVDFVDHKGAHLVWGVEPPLLVPHREQQREMFEGRRYVVRVAEENGRVFGSSRVLDFLDNSVIKVKERDMVGLLVIDRSDLGLSVIVDHRHRGLVHANEIFRQISIGDKLQGWVKTIREDNKLDITLRPIGYRSSIDPNVALLTKRIRSRKGILPLTDKSSAEEIYAEFGISKKAFKQALGALYKQRKVRIDENAVVWIG